MGGSASIPEVNPGGSPVVEVRFCDSWGYGSRVETVKDYILQAYPGANIKGTPVGGRTGCFEVTVNGKLVHSKLGGEGFVTKNNGDAFMAKVKQAAA